VLPAVDPTLTALEADLFMTFNELCDPNHLHFEWNLLFHCTTPLRAQVPDIVFVHGWKGCHLVDGSGEKVFLNVKNVLGWASIAKTTQHVSLPNARVRGAANRWLPTANRLRLVAAGSCSSSQSHYKNHREHLVANTLIYSCVC
jgi:hypothetical protein